MRDLYCVMKALTYPYCQVKMPQKEARKEVKQVTSLSFIQGSRYKTSRDVKPTLLFIFVLPNCYNLPIIAWGVTGDFDDWTTHRFSWRRHSRDTTCLFVSFLDKAMAPAGGTTTLLSCRSFRYSGVTPGAKFWFFQPSHPPCQFELCKSPVCQHRWLCILLLLWVAHNQSGIVQVAVLGFIGVPCPLFWGYSERF